MGGRSTSIVKQRQDPLRDRYRHEPAAASITDRARTVNGCVSDPFHGQVSPGDGVGAPWSTGIHRAVGGYHDAPNPGDILCAALAACHESTLLMVADRLGIGISSIDVSVTAEVDVRGTLVVDKSVPVGFQRIRDVVRITPAEGTDPAKLQLLLAAAEYSCVVLQTLRSGVAVEIDFDVQAEAPGISSPERCP